jgi:hypothetical protein
MTEIVVNDDAMSGLHHYAGHRPSDVTGTSGNQNFQGFSPSIWVEGVAQVDRTGWPGSVPPSE